MLYVFCLVMHLSRDKNSSKSFILSQVCVSRKINLSKSYLLQYFFHSFNLWCRPTRCDGLSGLPAASFALINVYTFSHVLSVSRTYVIGETLTPLNRRMNKSSADPEKRRAQTHPLPILLIILNF